MQSGIKEILYWILIYIYEPTGFSLLIAFLFMFFYKLVQSIGLQQSLKAWFLFFRNDIQYTQLIQELTVSDLKGNRITIRHDIDMMVEEGFNIVINEGSPGSFY